jgi:Yip1 domain
MSLSHDTSAGIGTTAPSSTLVPGLAVRVRGMLLAPTTEWLVIAGETITPGRLFAGYVMPMSALSALILLGAASITARAPLASLIAMAALTVCFEVTGVYVLSLIIDALAPFFRGEHGRRQALKTAAFAFTPLWLSSVFIPFPTWSAALQVLAGLYHTYLMYLGVRVLMKSPRDRALGYATTVVLCEVILGLVFSLAGTALGKTLHLSHFRAFG